jgi:DNA repair protein RAD50
MQVDVDDLKREEADWITEIERLRGLQGSNKVILELKERTIPPLEKQVGEETTQLEKVQEEVEEVCRCG